MMMDEGQERVKASYRDNYARLARIKAQYDPDNLFRINQNTRRAAAAWAAVAETGRPRRFAAYMQASARPTRSSIVRSPGSRAAAPIENETGVPSGRRAAPARSASADARTSASSSPVSGQSTANSSPPSRATR